MESTSDHTGFGIEPTPLSAKPIKTKTNPQRDVGARTTF